MPRVNALLEYWRIQPPVNELVASFLEYHASDEPSPDDDFPLTPGVF